MSLPFDWPHVVMLRCGVPLVILKYMIKECNPSRHNSDVAIVNCCYILRLFQNNHCKAVYQKYVKEIILHKIISSINVVHWRIILFYCVSHVTLMYNKTYSPSCVFASSCNSWNSATHSSVFYNTQTKAQIFSLFKKRFFSKKMCTACSKKRKICSYNQFE